MTAAMGPLQELMTRPEVAKALRVSLVTVDRLLGRRELPSLRVADRRLVRRADLEAFIASRVTGAEGAASETAGV